MTKQEFLNGFGFTPAELEAQVVRDEWVAYNHSKAKVDEIEVLIEMDCHDESMGDA